MPAPQAPRRTLTRRTVYDTCAGVALGVAVIVLSPGIAMAAICAFGALVVWSCVRAAGRAPRTAVTRAGSLAATLIVVAAILSYASAMSQRSNSTLAIRSVEWLRDNGARGLVNGAERLWYTLNAPSKGGPALTRLPQAGVSGRAAAAALQPVQPRSNGSPRVNPVARPRSAPPADRPPRVSPVMRPALRGEGVWRPTQHRFAGSNSAPVLVTTYRPDPVYPRVVAGLAWFDHRQTSVALYPGIQEPPVPSGGPGSVPTSRRRRLLATFNSGFKHKDSGGGFYARSRLLEPLVRGMGTIVVYRNGGVDVRAWNGSSRPSPQVAFARQNLPLIVDHGRPNPNLTDGPAWGATLGNAVLVWRSGIGVDAHGNLIYAAAPLQTVRGMAEILIHAGAVRAIELDINSYWVTLNTYAFTGARGAAPLLPSMTRSALRYLSPDDRDFFAVYLGR